MDRNEEIRRILNGGVSTGVSSATNVDKDKSVYRNYLPESEMPSNPDLIRMGWNAAAILMNQAVELIENPEPTEEDWKRAKAVQGYIREARQSIQTCINTMNTDIEAQKVSRERMQLEQQKLAIEQRKVDVVLEQNQLERARLLYSLGNTTDVPSDVTALLSSSSNSGSAYYKDKDGSLKPLSEEALAVDE